MAPSVLIIANPYESERLRRAVSRGGYEARLCQAEPSDADLTPPEPLVAVLLSSRLLRADSQAVLRSIRQKHPQGSMFVIFISDPSGPVADLEQTRKLGADSLLLRPVDQDELLAELRRCVADVGEQARLDPDARRKVPTLRGIRMSGEHTAVTATESRLALKLAQVARGDYFSLLDLDASATLQQVLQSYERLRVEFGAAQHDAAIDEDQAAQLEEVLAALEEAYCVLKEDQLREAYAAQIGKAP